MKYIFCILFIFASFDSISCTFPYSGEKYNKLIVIQKLNDIGEFYLELPKSVNSSQKPNVEIVKYTKKSYDLLINGDVTKKLESGLSIPKIESEEFYRDTKPESVKKLLLLPSNGKMIRKFKVTSNSDTIHIINVIWPVECCMCSTQAESNPLESY